MSTLRKRVKNVMLDTNIYGWTLAYAIGDRREAAISSYSLFNKLLHKLIDIKSLHNLVCDKIVYRSKPIEELKEKYFEEFGIQKFPITIEDCEIVASATLGEASFLVTENRRTLSNPRAIENYNKINKKKRLKTPEIITSTEALIKMFSF